MAQYPGNAGQKITLGEQTTADGLIFRGVANDTNVITPFSDTSAYIILDTVNSKFYHYNRTTTYWSLAGGGGGSTLDTATMLLPYWRAGKFSGVLPIANGGTGSNIGSILGSDSLHFQAGGSNKNVRLTPSTTGDIILNGDVSIGNRPAQEKLSVGLNTNVEVGFGLESGGKGYFGTYSPPTYTYDGIVLSINRRPTNGVFANTGFSHAEIAVVAANSDSYIGLYTGQTNNVIGTERMRIIKNGNIGIGTTTPGSRLVVKGSTDVSPESALNVTNSSDASLLFVRNDGNVGIGTNFSMPTQKLHVVGNARITALNGIGDIGADANGVLQAATSDMNLKNTIENSPFGLNEILLLNPVTFLYNDTDRKLDSDVKEVGFIAQDVFDIIPNAVSSTGTGDLQLDYRAITATLTKAIQEQQALIKALEQRIINLENK